MDLTYFYANELNEIFDYYHGICKGTNIPFLTYAVMQFSKQMSESIYPKISLQEVFDCKQFEKWYHGGFMNKIVIMVFQPDIDYYTTQELTIPQIQDALHLCYSLMINSYASFNIINYFDMTIFDYLKSMESNSLSITMEKYHPAFLFLFRYGPKTLENQQNMIRNFLKRKFEIKRAAVQVIEKHWLEVICNPYKKLGKNTLKMIQKKFYRVELVNGT